MKEISKFMCEKCHTIYDTTDACEACEREHSTTIATIDMRYFQGDVTPHLIIIDWDNGNHSEYVRTA